MKTIENYIARIPNNAYHYGEVMFNIFFKGRDVELAFSPDKRDISARLFPKRQTIASFVVSWVSAFAIPEAIHYEQDNHDSTDHKLVSFILLSSIIVCGATWLGYTVSEFLEYLLAKNEEADSSIDLLSYNDSQYDKNNQSLSIANNNYHNSKYYSVFSQGTLLKTSLSITLLAGLMAHSFHSLDEEKNPFTDLYFHYLIGCFAGSMTSSAMHLINTANNLYAYLTAKLKSE